MSEGELDELMGEVGGPCNVMGMVNMFQEKMAADGADPDELIHGDFMIKTKEIVGLFVAVKEEEKKVEEPAKVEEAAPADDEDADAKKKKEKKKRCHLRKKAQQLFNTKTRKIRKQRSTDESELEVLKFNRIGERLKKVNCQTGLP